MMITIKNKTIVIKENKYPCIKKIVILWKGIIRILIAQNTEMNLMHSKNVIEFDLPKKWF